MGVDLWDLRDETSGFRVNFWHWRAIVEAIRSLNVLPEAHVDELHDPFVGRITKDEARQIADAMRTRLLPTLKSGERLLLGGARTMVPDDGTFYREPHEMHRNYSTDREMLERFAAYCETCQGFSVR